MTTKLLLLRRCEVGGRWLEKMVATGSGERVGGRPHVDGTGRWVSSSRLDRGLDWRHRPDLALPTFKRRVDFTLFSMLNIVVLVLFFLSIKFYGHFICP